jgi:uncharacterized YigZ family protein
MAYTTIARPTEHAEIIKGSRFIALVTHVVSLEDALAQLSEQRNSHPDANHVCYAYKLDRIIKFSDDGEPGGTAGRPMLEVLERRNLDYVLATVTRYFGGTKLGAGGLVRAYSGTLAKALDSAGVTEIKDRTELKFRVPFDMMDSVHRLLDDWAELRKDDPEYTADGLVLSVELLAEDVKQLKDVLTSLTRGQVSWL